MTTPQQPPATTWSDLWISAAGLLLIVVWDGSGLDMSVARLFGTANGFAMRHAWPATVIYEGSRWIGIVLLALTVVNAVRPLGPWRSVERPERLWCLAVTLVCLGMTAALKRTSLTSCPWELQEFGGHAHQVSRWLAVAADGGSGHCFPSGHASLAFSFLALAFVLRRHEPRLARRLLIAVGLFGVAVGLVQIARGAHFPSHVLYTAWLCWVTTAASHHLMAWHRRYRAPLRSVRSL